MTIALDELRFPQKMAIMNLVWPLTALFGSILWPMLRPLTTVVIGLSIVASLKTFDIVLGMTKGGPGRVSETLALTMYNDTFVDSQYGLGSAIAVFLTVVTLVASILYLRQQLSKKNEL